MKQRITCIILLAGLVTMLAGCAETFNKKTSIQGSISVSAFGGPNTKTNYSGEFYEEIVNNVTHKYERINWVSGDSVRIYSTDKSQVGVGVVTHNADISDHYDYEIYDVKYPVDKKSNATLKKPQSADGTPLGLTWINNPYGIDFYGTYPPLAATYDNNGKLISFKGMTIPQNQTTPVDMSHAYMLAAPAQYVASDKVDDNGVRIPHMHMDFYPAFNAFYIELGSQRGEIQIDAIELVTTTSNGYLSGSYDYNIYDSNNNNQLREGPVVNGVVYRGDDNKNSVKVTLPSDTKIKPGEDGAAGELVKVTLLTLPPWTGTGLTNMVLNVYHDGKTEPAKLKLNYSSGTAINFPAFHKARITGLAMEGGSKWQLTVNDEVLPWNGYEATITDQVSIQDIKILGAIESTTAWQSAGGETPDSTPESPQYYNAAGLTKSNHYFDSNWVPYGAEGYGLPSDSNYDKKYQIRYLNRDLPDTEDNPRCFTLKFTPMAPTGGYWQLVPTYKPGDTESPRHFRFEVILPGGRTSEQLKGPILYSEVTVRIYPVNYDNSDINVYDVWFNCFISPSQNFTPSISADSEFQDVHGDGRFSYWVFRLAQYNGHYEQ